MFINHCFTAISTIIIFFVFNQQSLILISRGSYSIESFPRTSTVEILFRISPEKLYEKITRASLSLETQYRIAFELN